MASALLWAMSLRSLLTSARDPFKWRYTEADWFISQTGLDMTADCKSIFYPNPNGEDARMLAACLQAFPATETRQSGKDLFASFKAGWLTLLGPGQSAQPLKTIRSLPLPPTCSGKDSGGVSVTPSGLTHGSANAAAASAKSAAKPAEGHGGVVPGWDTPIPSLQVAPTPKPTPTAKRRGRPPTDSANKRPLPVGGANLNFAPEHTQKRCRIMDKVSTAQGRQRILDTIYEKLYATKTWTSHLCEIKLYCNMCEAASMVPFPITFLSISLFIGVLYDENYAAGTIPVYVSTVFRQQILNWQAIPEELRGWKSMLVRGSKRGSGEAHHMLPITIVMLCQIQQLPNFIINAQQIFLFRMMVLSFFFLLRSDESIGSDIYRGLTGNSFEFSSINKSVTIILGVTKTNQEGYICKRTLTCCCAEQPSSDIGGEGGRDAFLPICPYCCAKQLWHESKQHEKDPTKPLRFSKDKAPPTAMHLLAFIREALGRLGYCLVDPTTGKQNYGTHSLRRGGAQALVAAGWALETIKFFGRWLSSCVEVYLLSVPIETYGKDIALSMYMSAFRTLSGSESADHTKPDFSKSKVQTYRKPTLKVGMTLRVLLPDLVTTALTEIEEEELAELGATDLPSGYVEAELVAILPDYPILVADHAKGVVFHDSIQTAFPNNFSTPQARSKSDLCVALYFGPSESILIVCLQVAQYSIIQTPS